MEGTEVPFDKIWDDVFNSCHDPGVGGDSLFPDSVKHNHVYTSSTAHSRTIPQLLARLLPAPFLVLPSDSLLEVRALCS